MFSGLGAASKAQEEVYAQRALRAYEAAKRANEVVAPAHLPVRQGPPHIPRVPRERED